MISISHVIPSYHLSLQRLWNPKMSIVCCSAPDINNNKHDAIPLDNSSHIVQISEH